MKHFFTLVTLCAALAASSVNGDVVFSDNFDSYNDGDIVGQGGWAAHSGAGSNSQQVSSGTLLMSGTGEDVNNEIGAVMAAGDIWSMSFDVTVSSFGGGTTYFAHFKDSGSGFNGRVFALAPVAGGDFTFGIGESGSSDTAFATDLNFGQTYTVSSTYNFDTGLSVLTVDGVGSIESTTVDASQAMSQVAFRQGGGGGDFVIDNLSVSAVPEPGSLALLGLVGMAAVTRRRRA